MRRAFYYLHTQDRSCWTHDALCSASNFFPPSDLQIQVRGPRGQDGFRTQYMCAMLVSSHFFTSFGPMCHGTSIFAFIMASRLANGIRAVRVKRGLTQAELAAEAGISRQAFAAIESGAYLPNVAATSSRALAANWGPSPSISIRRSSRFT
jgi:DNA-binding XRE family transcriptional regulator